MPEQLARRGIGLERDHQVEVRALSGRSADRIGLVQTRDSDHARQRLDRLAKRAPAIAEVRAEPEEHSPRRRCGLRLGGHRDRSRCMPAVASCCGTGGRSLRTVTDTASARSSASETSATRSASRSSKREPLGHDHALDHGTQRAVVDRVVERVGAGGGRKVEMKVDVDLERLWPLLLLGQRPADPGRDQPAELDPVAHAGFGSSWAIVTS